MPNALNRTGVSHARKLIRSGRVDRDSDWDFTAEDANRILGDPPDWGEYRKWFLGKDPDADPETKAAWKYPYGKNGKVYLSGLRAAITRAAQQGDTEIENAARSLYEEAKGDGKASWMRIEARAPQVYDIWIYGDIGGDVTAREVIEQLSSLPEEAAITVRINSYGGALSDGIAIYNTIARRKVRVVIEGVAASAASLIAMAGSPIEMAENATLMVHGPWVGVIGNANELRDMADGLERMAEAMARIYASRPKVDLEKAREWVTDGRDHWFTAHEALEAGLIDAVIEARPDAARFVAAAKEVMNMAKRTEGAKPETAAAPERAEPAAAERGKEPETPRVVTLTPERIKEINAAKRQIAAPFRGRPDVDAFYEESIADPTQTLDQFRAGLLEILGRSQGPIASKPSDADPTTSRSQNVRVARDEAEKLLAGMRAWVATKAGVRHYVRAAGVDDRELDPGEFRGMTMVDMARDLLERAGVSTRGMRREEIVARALATTHVFAAGPYQTSSDFAVVLEDVMHKTLLGAYRTQPVTYPRWTRRGTVSDFRAHHRYRVGLLGGPVKIAENGQIPLKAIPDGEKETITADEYAVRFGLSRKAIVNDDLGVFSDIAAQIGAAVRRTEENAVIGLLVSNPTMSDGKALFHADHGNLGTAAAPGVSSFDEARTLMASQKDPNGEDYLDLRPAVWLGPIGLEGEVNVVVNSQYDPDAPNKLQRPNKVRGLVSDIIGTPRLTGTAWYVFADPAVAPVIEIAFLADAEGPRVETMQSWETTGVEWRVTHAFGVAAVDWRGAVKNPGA